MRVLRNIAIVFFFASLSTTGDAWTSCPAECDCQELTYGEVDMMCNFLPDDCPTDFCEQAEELFESVEANMLGCTINGHHCYAYGMVY
jgi:hypothetical protein